MKNRNLLKITLFFLCFGLILACSKPGTHSTLKMQDKFGPKAKPDLILNGLASWYGHPFHGRITANGERYNMFELTAAHKSLPFGSMLRVHNLNNDKTIIVRVNDRGPYIGRRILDLSYTAAKNLDMVKDGVINVKIEVFKPTPKLVAKK